MIDGKCRKTAFDTTTVLLTPALAFVLLLMPVAAHATAEEEPPDPVRGLASTAARVPKSLTGVPVGVPVKPPTGASAASESLAMAEVEGADWGNVENPEQFRRQAMLVANYIQNHNRKLPWDEADRTARAIVQFSGRYGVDYRLLTSLIATESSFRRDAVSSSGAIGMGQLKPDTARWLGVVDPYDPVDNIAGTARFLAWLLRRFNGNLEAALSAYYQGPGYVERNGITPVCMPYLEKVNRALGGLL
jgi:hypothetical protein